MTGRERWLAALRMQPVDRLPFWPKLNAAYAQHQATPFRNMTPAQLHERIGSDIHVDVGACIRVVRRTTAVDTNSDGITSRTVYHTPYGDLTAVYSYDTASASWHPVVHPVSTIEHVKIMTAWYLDATVEADDRAIEKARQAHAAVGNRGSTQTSMGTTPLMHYVQDLAGIETAQYLLYDHPDAVQELLAAMTANLLRRVEIAADICPADLLYLTENTSTTLISPEQFRTHCAPVIRAVGEICRTKGRLLCLHMCGHLRALLPDLAKLPVAAFEAFTSPPVGNTTLADGRAYCPEVCLIGGTNAALWTQPSRHIIEALERDLQALPHHRGIVITSAGVMPPCCPPQTIMYVADWVRSFSIRL